MTRWMGGWLVLGMLLLCGCLKQERTPYNEVSFLEESSSEKMVNAWPIYNGNGRVNYVAWPLVKWSSGCFAFLPFYNYDHGIHDVAFIASAVPKDGEYRLWPIFYRSPEKLYLFPGGFYKHGLYLAPMFWYEKDEDGATFFLSPFYSQRGHAWESDPYECGTCVNTKTWYRDRTFAGPLWLMGHTMEERRSDEQEEWKTHDALSWVFPLFWHGCYQEEVTSVLFPIYYTRYFKDGDGGSFATPFAGWGWDNESPDRHFWYALTAGRYHGVGYDGMKKGTQWVLPFWLSWQHEVEEWYRGKKQDVKRMNSGSWTPLTWHETWENTCGYDTSEWYVGPLGIPLLADIYRSPGRDQTYITPFNLTKHYYVYRDANTTERYALERSQRKGIGGLLYNWDRYHLLPSHAHPVQALKSYEHKQGHRFSLLGGLLTHTDIYKRGQPIEKQRQFGWCLWNHKEDTQDAFSKWDYPHKTISTTSTFTPLMSWGKTIDEGKKEISSSKCLLMDSVVWTASERWFDFDLFWGILWSSRYETDGSQRQRCLTSFVFNQRIRADEPEEEVTHRCKDCWWGSTYCAQPPTQTRIQKDGERIDTQFLAGLLYYHDKKDWLVWEYLYGSPRPEKPTVDTYTDECAVLTPLVYFSESERDGSFKRRTLRGLIHDHTYDAQHHLETLGILGFIYRYNGYKDGTRERAIFPFIKTTVNNVTETWSFSLLHKLFRMEHTPEGNTYTVFWFEI